MTRVDWAMVLVAWYQLTLGIYLGVMWERGRFHRGRRRR
jgi:cytochrome c biogenesis factor